MLNYVLGSFILPCLFKEIIAEFLKMLIAQVFFFAVKYIFDKLNRLMFFATIATFKTAVNIRYRGTIVV